MDNKSVLQIPIEDIVPNRFQPRTSFDDNSLNELAASIKVHGIIQPLVVRRLNDKYEIIAGERRYRAAKKCGLLSVPAILSDLTDGQSAEVAIVENVQRKDLTAIEEARSYKSLLDQGYMSQEDLSKKMGLSQSAISNKMRLLSLSEEVQSAILNEKISERHARSLLKVKKHITQNEILNKIITERLTVKQLEEEIKKYMSSEEAPEVSAVEIVNNPIDLTEPEKPKSKFFNFVEETPVNMDVEVKETPEFDDIEILDDDFFTPTNSVATQIKEDLKKYDNLTIDETEDGTNTVITIKIPK